MNLQEAQKQAREKLIDLYIKYELPIENKIVQDLDQIVTDSYQAGCRETAERIGNEIHELLNNNYLSSLSWEAGQICLKFIQDNPEVGK